MIVGEHPPNFVDGQLPINHIQKFFITTEEESMYL